ncbi:MAG: TRAP transporter small permease subunit [Pararhodobacter sp.]|nr:TRAP transporter small permease subunit [Pararhodobacter sp.]
MLMIVADVALRAINPAWRIFGMLDYVEFALSWMIFLAIATTMLARAYVSVDLIDLVLRATPRMVLRVLGLLLAVGVLALTAWQTVPPALDARDWGDRTLDLGLPKFWYWVSIWVGLGIAAIGGLLAMPDEIAESRQLPKPPGSDTGVERE